MVQRLHAGYWQELPALCLGNDATFETNVISDATPYGNRLLWITVICSSILIYSGEVTFLHYPDYRQVRGQGQLLNSLPGAQRDSLMCWRSPQRVFVIMTALTWALWLKMVCSVCHPAVTLVRLAYMWVNYFAVIDNSGMVDFKVTKIQHLVLPCIIRYLKVSIKLTISTKSNLKTGVNYILLTSFGQS